MYKLLKVPYLSTPGTDSCWQTWRVQLAEWGLELHYSTEITVHHRQTRSHGSEGWKDASEDNKRMIVQCATFSKSLNLRNIDKNVSDIRIRIRFPFESSFWISVSGCKLTLLPDIQPGNRIVIISAINIVQLTHVCSISSWINFVKRSLWWPNTPFSRK